MKWPQDQFCNNCLRLTFLYMLGATMASAWLSGKGIGFIYSVLFGLAWPFTMFVLAGD